MFCWWNNQLWTLWNLILSNGTFLFKQPLRQQRFHINYVLDKTVFDIIIFQISSLHYLQYSNYSTILLYSTTTLILYRTWILNQRMNFSILLGLCLFDLIHGRYFLIKVNDQQVHEPKPPASNCIPPNGECSIRRSTLLSSSFLLEVSRILKQCCHGYTCVWGTCLKLQINIDGSGKMSDIGA